MSKIIEYKLPKMSEDFAWWLGVLFADGCVKYTSKGEYSGIELACTTDEPKITNKFTILTKKFFDYDCKIGNSNNGKGFVLRIHSKHICELLNQKGMLKQKHNRLKLPLSILRASSKTQAAFVSGLWDGDGYISLKHNNRGKVLNQIGLSLVSHSFINELSQLLPTNIYEIKYVSKANMRSIGKNETDMNKIHIFTKNWKQFSEYLNQSVKVQTMKEKFRNGQVLIPGVGKGSYYQGHVKLTHADGSVWIGTLGQKVKEIKVARTGNFWNLYRGERKSCYGYVQMELVNGN